MKKSIYLLSLLLTILTTSCRRQFTCYCDHELPVKEYTIQAKSKKEAALQCPHEVLVARYRCSIK
ncbi:MAG: hypothetical protein H6551_07655 [Chitinophagales bacterium]|nr:hypothetical protein [Chitinophagaceae bacterium]MCB9065005.1 hypothetical protein [Chitinophagales bacterium]